MTQKGVSGPRPDRVSRVGTKSTKGTNSETRILLYYRFTPIADPTAVMLWQRTLCDSLGLRGRIIISHHGINGTVGGSLTAVKQYIRRTREYPGFHDMEFKWSPGSAEDFPKLSVKVRDEIVSFGAADELRVDEHGVVGGGTHLSPAEVNDLVEQKRDTGNDVVFFDGRNAAEAAVGRFRDAVVPDTVTTHDFVRELESGKYDWMKDRPIVTYCTGGVRCEILSALMLNRGFTEVYQIDGGIVRYGERFGNDGLWEGTLTVFDGRENLPLSCTAEPIGRCIVCDAATSRLQNCAEDTCQQRLVVCEACGAEPRYCEASATAAS